MKTKGTLSHQVAIIRAGPYGLATAAHLCAADLETCVFGEPMEFWESQMPEGMYLGLHLLRAPLPVGFCEGTGRTGTVFSSQ